MTNDKQRRAWRRYAVFLAIFRGALAVAALAMVAAFLWTDAGLAVVPAMVVVLFSGVLVTSFACPNCELPFTGPLLGFGNLDWGRNEFGDRCYYCNTPRLRPFARRAGQPRA